MIKSIPSTMKRLGVEFRTYNESDHAAVWRLHNEGLHQTGSHGGDGPWDDDLRSIRETYLANGGVFIVALVAGKVVGMGAVHRVTDDVAEVKRMRVDAAWQGKGIGRALLERVETSARAVGYCRLQLV
jgi:GNAT superfamily N-acetyltransferase